MNILVALMQGVPLTLLLWAAGQVIGLMLAVPVAAARMSRHRWLRYLAMGWIELFRGIPTLVWLFIVFFGLASVGFQLTAIVASIAALGIVSSAYLAEIYRSGFESVPVQQYEASLALSLPLATRLKAVILPQAFPVILEGTASYSIHLLKETALASLIGVIDLMAIANYQVERGIDGPVVFALTGALYLLACLALAGLAHLAGRRLTANGTGIRRA